MKYFLISEDTFRIVRDALMAPTHAENDSNCPDGYNDCSGCQGDETRRNALHELESALHTTDAIPADYAG